MRRSSIPEINAGSTADIAFLLLIFFLVTTVFPNEKGIVRKLPERCQLPECTVPLKERNTLKIYLNREGNVMVNEQITAKDQLVIAFKEFLDNNGDGSCDYCKGLGLETSSENRQHAVLVLSMDRESEYGDYIAIQNALTSAFFELRAAFAKNQFKVEISQLTEEQMKIARDAYPLRVAEAELR